MLLLAVPPSRRQEEEICFRWSLGAWTVAGQEHWKVWVGAWEIPARIKHGSGFVGRRTAAPIRGHAAPFQGAFQTFQGSPPRLPDPQLPSSPVRRATKRLGPGLVSSMRQRDASSADWGRSPLTVVFCTQECHDNVSIASEMSPKC